MFRKITLFRISISAIILLTLTSFNGRYPEPVYITMYDTEDYTIRYSRSIAHNIDNVKYKIADLINKKYQGMTINEINERASLMTYKESRRETEEKMKSLIDKFK